MPICWMLLKSQLNKKYFNNLAPNAYGYATRSIQPLFHDVHSKLLSHYALNNINSNSVVIVPYMLTLFHVFVQNEKKILSAAGPRM